MFYQLEFHVKVQGNDGGPSLQSAASFKGFLNFVAARDFFPNFVNNLPEVVTEAYNR